MTCRQAVADRGPTEAAKFGFRESDHTCEYCGSLHPDDFMARLEAGDVKLGPTDKGYKVYVDNDGGAPFLRSVRRCPRDAQCTGPKDCVHWTTEVDTHAKFYFYHLSVEQMKRFVELSNEGRLKLDDPGHFYVRPFFMRPATEGG